MPLVEQALCLLRFAGSLCPSCCCGARRLRGCVERGRGFCFRRCDVQGREKRKKTKTQKTTPQENYPNIQSTMCLLPAPCTVAEHVLRAAAAPGCR